MYAGVLVSQFLTTSLDKLCIMKIQDKQTHMNFTNLVKIILLITISFICICCTTIKDNEWELNSPDNTLQISVSLQRNIDLKTMLTYKVDRITAGKTSSVIETSPLGIDREDQQYSENLSFVSSKEVIRIDEKYRMRIGRQSEIRNNANELELTFKNDKGSLIQLVLRAYNDGVAFKYNFPDKSKKEYTVKQELTGFKIPENGKAWLERYDSPSKWSPAYEKDYENGIAIGTSSPNVEGWAFPALFHADDNWILISEANLSPNYCGVRLEQNATKGLYKIRFPEAKEAEGFGRVNPRSTLPWSMPWRTIIIGTSPADILESQLINNVSDASIPGDFSWVKPGRASWSWVSDNESTKSFKSLKEFVDLSAEMNWEYSLVDANWNLMQGGSIDQLVKYAKSKGVGLFLWYNSGGPNNIITEAPRDIIFNVEKRKAEFKKLNEWGVKGIKIDFWNSDKQSLIQLYTDVLKDAAEYHLMVNFHGCTIPRGWSRTYPNLVSMEAVKGEECYLFDKTYASGAPVQNSILPFTRNVVGPMDYTPVGLSNFKFPHETTYAHELALTLVFNSGILHFCDNVKIYRSLPDYVKNFLKIVPVVFDETKYISGEPGKDIVLACRKGNVWYVAGINGENVNKEIKFSIPTTMNDINKLNIILDGKSANLFSNNQFTYKKGDVVNIKILPKGGFVGILSK